MFQELFPLLFYIFNIDELVVLHCVHIRRFQQLCNTVNL